MASEGRVNYIFNASLSRAAGTFRIDYSLQKADTLEIIASDYVTGIGEESFPSLVDDMTIKVKENFELSAKEIVSDIDKEVSKITASSPEAYKYFSEGWKYNNRGEYRLSIQFLEKAIGIDSEFAMENKTGSIWPYANASQAYMAKGLYDEAKEILEYYIENFSDNFIIRNRLALNYFNQGKLDLALAQIDKAISLNPVFYGNFQLKGDIFQCKGDLIKAEKEYQKMLESEEQSDHLSYRMKLGSLYLLQGRFIESKDLIRQGIEQAKKTGEKWGETWGYLYLVYLNLRSGDLEKAQKEYERITSLTSGRLYWGDIYARSFYMLGKIYEQQGQKARAIEHYEKFLELWKNADPGIPEVDDAGKRLAELKRE